MSKESTGRMLIEDKAPVRSKFIQIPYCLLTWAGVTKSNLRVYLFYKMICGERPKGRCWTSLSTICRILKIDRHTAVKCRDELVECGLIEVEEGRSDRGQALRVIKLVDIWPHNEDFSIAAMFDAADDEPDDTVRPPSGETPLATDHQVGSGILPPPGSGETPLAKWNSSTQTIGTEQEGIKNNRQSTSGSAASVDQGECASPSLSGAVQEEVQANHTQEKQPPTPPPKKKPPLRKPPSRNTAPGDNGFNLDGSEDKKPAQDFATTAAEKLGNALISHRLLFRTPSLARWSKQIREFLIGPHAPPADEFQETLDWYVDHAGHRYAPKAHSAESFLQKYGAIAAARERLGGSSRAARQRLKDGLRERLAKRAKYADHTSTPSQ